MSHRRSQFVAILLLALSVSQANAGTFRGWLTLDDFEASAQGEHWTPVQFSGGAALQALIGADVVTAPPAVIKALASHPLTDKGLEQFMADWAKTGQKIL